MRTSTRPTALLVALLLASPLAAQSTKIAQDTIVPSTDVWTVGATEELLVEAGAILKVEGVLEIAGSVVVDGSLDALSPAPASILIAPGGSLEVHGDLATETIENHGRLIVRGEFLSEGRFENEGRFDNHGATTNAGVFTNRDTFYNFDSFTNEGTTNNRPGATTTNQGEILNNASLLNSGTLINRLGSGMQPATIVNWDVFQSYSDALIDNLGSEILNRGEFRNDGELHNHLDARLTNNWDGILWIGSYSVVENSEATITNAGGDIRLSGTLINRPRSLLENLSTLDLPHPRPDQIECYGGSLIINEGIFWNERIVMSWGDIDDRGGHIRNLCDGAFTDYGSFDNRSGFILNDDGVFTHTPRWLGPLPIDTGICLRR